MNQQGIHARARLFLEDVDDVDDVETHGIKEVMVGLSAATLLAGGVVAVVDADGGARRTRHIQVSNPPHERPAAGHSARP